MALCGMLRRVIFVELRKECVALAAQPNPAPSRVALDRGCFPAPRALRAPPARPSFPLCVRAAIGEGWSAPGDAAATLAMGSAPSLKAGSGAGDAAVRVVPPHSLAFREEGACQPRLLEE